MTGYDRRELILQSRVTDAGQIEISVIDSGPGLAEAAAKQLFTPFVTTKKDGTGLGLAIVKQTVVAHRGHVEAESGLGTGAVIRLIFPAAMTAGSAG